MTEDEEHRSSADKVRSDAAREPDHVPPLIEGATMEADPTIAAASADLGNVEPGARPHADPETLAGSPSVSPEAAKGPTAPVTDGEALAREDAGAPFGDLKAVANGGGAGSSPYDTGTLPRATPDGSVPGRHGTTIPVVLGIVTLVLLAALAYLFFTLPGAQRFADVDSGLADLKARVATLEAKQAAPGTLTQRLDGLDAQVTALKASVATLSVKASAAPASPASDFGAQLSALDTKVAGLGHDVDAVRSGLGDIPKPDFGPIDGKVAAIDGRVTSLQTKVDALPDTVFNPMSARIDGLDTRLKPLEAEQAAAKTPQRATEARQNGSAAEARAAPLAVTAQAVVRAIDADQPFAADVKALETLGAEPALLQPLQAVAVAGAPILKDLRNDLDALRERMLAGSAPTPSGSYMDRLLAGASTLVRVRPLGSVVGDTPAAILARMDQDIGADELDAALAEWPKLPEAARSISKGLLERITLRRSAEVAARTIAANAIGAMASTKP